MIDMTNVAFIMPYRKNNNQDREDNILNNLMYLNSVIKSNIIVAEQRSARVSRLDDNKFKQFTNLNIQHIDYITDKECFHKTKLYNMCLSLVTVPIISACDIDVLFPINQMVSAVTAINNGCDYCYPYSDQYVEISKRFPEERLNFLKTYDFDTYINSVTSTLPKLRNTKLPGIFRDCPPGGCIYIKTNSYINIGLENEEFCGYGPEDVERKTRLEKLQLTTTKIKGNLFHIEHDYEPNHRRITTKQNAELMQSLSRYSKAQLVEYYAKKDYKTHYGIQ